MADGITFRYDTLTPGLTKLPGELRSRIALAMRKAAPEVAAYARRTAPWRDRTGNARNGLKASSYRVGSDVYGVLLYHSVPYGIFLETKHDGRYRVIVPTIEAMFPRVMHSVAGLLDVGPSSAG